MAWHLHQSGKTDHGEILRGLYPRVPTGHESPEPLREPRLPTGASVNQEIEIVLASGVFARIRKPTIGEYIKTVVRSGGKTAEDQYIGLLSLAAVCVKLDGEYLSA